MRVQVKKLTDIRTRLFQSWFRLTRPMTLGVRGLVSDHDGRVVLVRHTYVEGWFLPGGGVERAETAVKALERELAEEAGVGLVAEPRLLGVFSNHRSFPNDHVLLYAIGADAWTRCDSDCEGEIAELCWAEPARPPEGTTPGTRRRLEEWVSGAPPAAYW